MRISISRAAPRNGRAPRLIPCGGSCGRRLVLSDESPSAHTSYLCSPCWSALRAALLRVIRVLEVAAEPDDAT